MSTMDIALLLNGVNRGSAGKVERPQTPLRMVLVEGEAIRLPLSRVRMSILSGIAWITQAGQDLLLQAGSTLELSDSADRAVVSSIGTQPLFFEVR